MQTIKMKGKSVEEATEGALQVLGAKRDEVEVKIINEGKAGVLGVFGGEEAEVEVMLKGNLGEHARDLLQDILDKMGFLALASLANQEEEAVSLEVKGEEMGRIIGKEGATLDALQILLGTIFSKRLGRRIRVQVDASGYRRKKEQTLERLARQTAEEVAAAGQEIVLPPMPSSDRRIIHLALQDNPKVLSYSRGERGGRQVVVAPKGEKGVE